MREEVERENKAQEPAQIKRKVKAEAARQGGGIRASVKAVLHHADRDLAGEYERRDDEDAQHNANS